MPFYGFFSDAPNRASQTLPKILGTSTAVFVENHATWEAEGGPKYPLFGRGIRHRVFTAVLLVVLAKEAFLPQWEALFHGTAWAQEAVNQDKPSVA